MSCNYQVIFFPLIKVYMNIDCLNEDIIKDLMTHQELAPTNVLSILASLTPFSDHNQSPRNMYQCQVNNLIAYLPFKFIVYHIYIYIKMAKQIMGTPATS